MSIDVTLMLQPGRTEIWLSPEPDRPGRHRLAARIAAYYLSVSASELTLGHQPDGRPYIPGTSLTVSLSSSMNLCAVAFSRSPALGVDVQSVLRPDEVTETLLRNTLSASELSTFHSSPLPAHLHYTAIWARKEAILKALGTGLRLDPRTLPLPAVTFDMPEAVILPTGDRLLLTTWQLSETHVLSVCTADRAVAFRDPQSVNL
jgi:phosphopantetheinyl transferase